MNKNEILEQLRSAKAAHISWVQKAKMLIGGFSIDEKAIPINSTECRFGQWFYSDAQKLNGLQNNPLECMHTIEALHFQLHDTYMHIFQIYYHSNQQGFFSKLFGNKKKVSDAQKEEAQAHFNTLQETSKALIEEINRMERRILSTPQEQIEEIR